jgi:protein-L-isoaspartate(D-aspartate) O-methyltransferase
MDFVTARTKMVDGQVRPSDVTDLRIVTAMLELPRERFVAREQAEFAYADLDLPIRGQSDGSTPRCLIRPRALAKLIQAADIQESDRVLDVGGTTGYGAAVISRLAHEVLALEDDAALAQAARKLLAECDIDNVSAVTGELAAGWAAKAPYDAIVLEGAVEVAPKALFAQLREGGRLVCVEGRGLSGKATAYRCVGGVASGRPVFDAATPLLPGFAKPAAFVF